MTNINQDSYQDSKPDMDYIISAANFVALIRARKSGGISSESWIELREKLRAIDIHASKKGNFIKQGNARINPNSLWYALLIKTIAFTALHWPAYIVLEKVIRWFNVNENISTLRWVWIWTVYMSISAAVYSFIYGIVIHNNPFVKLRLFYMIIGAFATMLIPLPNNSLNYWLHLFVPGFLIIKRLMGARKMTELYRELNRFGFNAEKEL